MEHSCEPHPRHGHRTPAELAEEEGVSLAAQDRCEDWCLAAPQHFSLIRWSDAHPIQAGLKVNQRAKFLREDG